jgi:hypothetical protein
MQLSVLRQLMRLKVPSVEGVDEELALFRICLERWSVRT